MSKRDDLLTAARRFEAKAARTRRRRLAAQFEDVAAVLREVALDGPAELRDDLAAQVRVALERKVL